MKEALDWLTKEERAVLRVGLGWSLWSLMDLLSYRDISNETGYKFQVMHQSPQLLIIKNGAVVAHESHGAISNLDIKQFL